MEGAQIPHRLMAGRRSLVPVIEVRILVGERFAGGIGIRTALMMRHLKGVAGFDSRAKHSDQNGLNLPTCTNNRLQVEVLGSTGVRLPGWSPGVSSGLRLQPSRQQP